MLVVNLFLVLQQARHCIKTDYGLSKPVYGNKDENEPIAGISQSNGLGPALLCLISTIIINCCKRKRARHNSYNSNFQKKWSLS